MANQMELSRMTDAIKQGPEAALYFALLEIKKLQHYYHVDATCQIPDNCGHCIAMMHVRRALKNYENVRSEDSAYDANEALKDFFRRWGKDADTTAFWDSYGW